MSEKVMNPTTIDVEMAEAFKAYKEAETLYNFYRQQMLEKFEQEGTNCTSFDFEDGSKISVDYVPPSTSRSLNQPRAKKKLAELMGDAYNEDEFYDIKNKSSYVVVSAVEYPE